MINLDKSRDHRLSSFVISKTIPKNIGPTRVGMTRVERVELSHRIRILGIPSLSHLRYICKFRGIKEVIMGLEREVAPIGRVSIFEDPEESDQDLKFWRGIAQNKMKQRWWRSLLEDFDTDPWLRDRLENDAESMRDDQ